MKIPGIPNWLKHKRLRWLRVLIGCCLVLFGVFGFLPVLGFWMLPLGLSILAIDNPAAGRANDWLAERAKRVAARYRAFRGNNTKEIKDESMKKTDI